MTRFGKAWRLYGVSVVVLAVSATEAAVAAARWRAARKAEALVAAERRELQRLTTAGPVLDETKSGRRAAAIASAEWKLAELLAALSDRGRSPAVGVPITPSPASSADAFFELAGFVGRMRAQAEALEIGLRPDERFGLSSYDHEGPAPGLVAKVHGQREQIERLLTLLFATHPRRLLAVRREQPDLTQLQSGGDFFGRVPSLSLGEPGLVETGAFRLEFLGRTSCLRDLLHALAVAEPAIFVRNIVVEPEHEDRSKATALDGGARSVKPLIEPVWSKFAVTVELPALQPVAEGNHPLAEAKLGTEVVEAARDLWGIPPAQSAGPAWVYDMFTPPVVWENPNTRMLSAGPSCELALAGPPDNPGIDLDLVAVRPVAFRLQLLGCLGGAEESELVGVFASLPSGETLLGRAGTRFAELGLKINRITLRAEPPGGDDPGGAGHRGVTADLWDEQASEERQITDRCESRGAAPIGLFASRQQPELQRELKVGDTMELNDGRYRVERLNLDPPFAVVARSTPGKKGTAILQLVARDKAGGPAAVTAGGGNSRIGGGSP